MPVVLLITGGRKYGLPTAAKPVEAAWAERRRFGLTLCAIDAAESIALLIHGGAPGADDLAERWAWMFGVPVRRYPVDHKLDGPWPGAGPRRNARMLHAERFNLSRVLAFPGGPGTANMVSLAREARIEVQEVT